MLSILTLAGVIAASFACTFILMWAMHRAGGFDDPATRARSRRPPPRPPLAPLGPDDDLAFIWELRRRIELGHFRH